MVNTIFFIQLPLIGIDEGSAIIEEQTIRDGKATYGIIMNENGYSNSTGLFQSYCHDPLTFALSFVDDDAWIPRAKPLDSGRTDGTRNSQLLF